MNNKYLQEKHHILLCLLISLLFHLFFVAYITLHHRPIDTLKDKSSLKTAVDHNNVEWVETKTRAVSTPVYFRSTPVSEQKTQAQDLYDHQSQPDLQKPLQSSMDIQPAITQAENHDNTTATIIKEQKKYNHANHQPVTPPRTTQQRTLPSFSQLAQGMMNYMQENGVHSVSMLGKKSGAPTDEQLKYERYLERLNLCLHNSFVINVHKQPQCNPPEGSITVYLALNQDGSIYNLALKKSCGNHQIDHFVMHVLREASSSFPPVPHYLPHNPFAIHYVIGLKPLFR